MQWCKQKYNNDQSNYRDINKSTITINQITKRLKQKYNNDQSNYRDINKSTITISQITEI